MAEKTGTNLGLCFNGRFIYYAISESNEPGFLQHIGSAELHSDAALSIKHDDNVFFETAKALIETLKKKYKPTSVRILTAPTNECWAILPRTIYRDSQELDAYVKVLQPDVNRADIEIHAHAMSSREQMMLCVRKKRITERYQALTAISRKHEMLADFQIGNDWNRLTGINGSYLFIGCYTNVLTVSSYLLGKLRATTFFSYKDVRNLPYFWRQASQNLRWINGYHEQIYLYGARTRTVKDQLQPLWDKHADVITMNTLDSINVKANEQTYGFDLAEAFPAIMLALPSKQKA